MVNSLTFKISLLCRQRRGQRGELYKCYKRTLYVEIEVFYGHAFGIWTGMNLAFEQNRADGSLIPYRRLEGLCLSNCDAFTAYSSPPIVNSRSGGLLAIRTSRFHRNSVFNSNLFSTISLANLYTTELGSLGGSVQGARCMRVCPLVIFYVRWIRNVLRTTWYYQVFSPSLFGHGNTVRFPPEGLWGIETTRYYWVDSNLFTTQYMARASVRCNRLPSQTVLWGYWFGILRTLVASYHRSAYLHQPC